MRLLTRTGAGYPLWFSDLIGFTSIATADYSPIATYLAGAKTTALESAMNVYIKNGFGVKNATDDAGYIYAITWEQYQSYLSLNRDNPLVITGLVPKKIDLAGHEWCLTPLIKVFADNDGTYASTVTAINVGIIQ